MDQSQALHKLLETADLIGMLEDLIRAERLQELSPASWAGMRITLNTMRDSILSSHAELSRGLVKSARRDDEKSGLTVSRMKARDERRRDAEMISETEIASIASESNGESKDLKSALERFVER